TEDGWNYLSNPYPSTIDWDLLTRNASVNSSVAVWDAAGGAYIYWNGTSGSLANGHIASGQAFWVQTNASGPTLSATEAAKVNNKTVSLFRTETLTDHLIIAMSDGKVTDRTYVHFKNGATEGFDTEFDARKLSNQIFNLSSLTSGGEKLAINTLPNTLAGCDFVLPLSITNVKPGAYSLNFSDLTTFSQGVGMILVDNFTANEFSISEGSNYQFDVTADVLSYGKDRFQVKFQGAAIDQNLVYNSTFDCSTPDYVNISIENSQKGITYSLYNSATKVSADFIGNGGPLNMIVSKSLLQLGKNILDVSAINGACSSLTIPQAVSVTIENVSEVASVVDGTTCGMGQVTLEASGAPANGYYRWYDAIDAVDPIAGQNSNILLTQELSSTKWYYVTVVNALGCESTQRTRVVASVIDNSSLTRTLGLNHEISCNNELVNVNIENSIAGITYGLYNGTNKLAEVQGTDGLLTLSVNKASLPIGANSLDIKAGNSVCGFYIHKNVVNFTVDQVKEITRVSGALSCGVGSVTLQAEGAMTGESYRWYDAINAVSPIAGATNGIYVTPELGQTTSYWVTIVNSSGCESINRVQVDADINILDIPSFTEDGNVLTSSYAVGNQWYMDGQPISGAVENTYTATESGSYSVEVTNNTCQASSVARYHLVLGVDENMSNGIVVYPNPVKDILKVKLPANSSVNKAGLFDMSGRRLIYKPIKLNSDYFELDLRHVNNGMFLLLLEGDKETFQFKVNKE
ncbi:MAG: T9SS type A sorting domain-containing protein, partial [Cyclobacteriaceae bacterium]|nr:T9SS type A sorting domain-containing protein [Cyclobacteriaceae bacterium]